MLSYAHHYAIFWGYGGGALFIVSVTCSIVLLFTVRIVVCLNDIFVSTTTQRDGSYQRML